MNSGLEGYERSFRCIVLEDVGDRLMSLGRPQNLAALRLRYCGHHTEPLRSAAAFE